MGGFTGDQDPWVHELLMPYALLGWKEWAQTNDEPRRRRHRECLEGNIVDHEYDVRQVITSPASSRIGGRFPLLPMPKAPDTIEQAFFLPLSDPVEGSPPRYSFELFIIVGDNSCMAFRWELGHSAPSTHGYSHVQMCRRLARRELGISCLPDWIPDNYPAVPIRAANSFGLFLCMVTAMHGLEGGILQLIVEMMQGEPGARNTYIDKIRRHFNNT